MKRLYVKLVFLLVVFFSAEQVFTVEPIPRVLTQKKLDLFIATVEPISADDAVMSAWDQAYQQATMNEVMNQNSTLLNASAATAACTILLETCSIVKKNAAAAGRLNEYQWTNEFWDYYTVVLIGTYYVSVTEFNRYKTQEEVSDEDREAMKNMELPPVERFINGTDYELFKKNFSRINGRISDGISGGNAYGSE